MRKLNDVHNKTLADLKVGDEVYVEEKYCCYIFFYSCHIVSIQKYPHNIIYFETDSSNCPYFQGHSKEKDAYNDLSSFRWWRISLTDTFNISNANTKS